MIRNTFVAAATLATVLLASPATAYVARNGLVIEPVGSGDFRVNYRGRSGAADFWCAAGDYAATELGAPGDARIWRLTPVPRQAGRPMDFSMRSDNAVGETGMMELGKNDGSYSVAHARALCWDDE